MINSTHLNQSHCGVVVVVVVVVFVVVLVISGDDTARPAECVCSHPCFPACLAARGAEACAYPQRTAAHTQVSHTHAHAHTPAKYECG